MADEQFEHLYLVGAGWTQVRLTLSDKTALIEYDSSFMGQGPLRYILSCEHKKFSEAHGALITQSIEQYQTTRAPHGATLLTGSKETIQMGKLIDPDADDEMLDSLNTLHLEYVRMAEPQLRLNPFGGMWGIHDWNNTFSLILLIHFAGFWYSEDDNFEKTLLGQGLANLDKMYFAIADGRYKLKT